METRTKTLTDAVIEEYVDACPGNIDRAIDVLVDDGYGSPAEITSKVTTFQKQRRIADTEQQTDADASVGKPGRRAPKKEAYGADFISQISSREDAIQRIAFQFQRAVNFESSNRRGSARVAEQEVAVLVIAEMLRRGTVTMQVGREYLGKLSGINYKTAYRALMRMSGPDGFFRIVSNGKHAAKPEARRATKVRLRVTEDRLDLDAALDVQRLLLGASEVSHEVSREVSIGVPVEVSQGLPTYDQVPA